MIGDAEDLIATLQAAEASLRAVAAEVLSAGALMRAERESTRRARAAVAGLSAQRTLSLPTGWAELVEVDEALDALLARLAEAPPPATRRPGRLPSAVESADPAQAAVEEGRPPAEETGGWMLGLPDAETGASAEELDAFEVVDDDEIAYEPIEEDDEYAPATVAPAADDDEDDFEALMAQAEAARRAIEAAARADDDTPDYVAHDDEEEEVPDEADTLDDAEEYEDADESDFEPIPYDEEMSYVTYVDEDEDEDEADDEELPEWAVPIYADEPDEEPAPAPKKRPPLGQAKATGSDRKLQPRARAAAPEAEPEAEEEWSFVAPEEDHTDPGEDDRYASTRHERMSLEDLEDADGPAAIDLSGAVEPDAEPTAVHAMPEADRPHAAAIQLAADGSSKVLGADEHDDEVIELGDTVDYGDEEELEDDHTGILGVGVVEYDEDIEDLDELEDLEEESGGLELTPGAPELTPAEVSDLFTRAQEMAARNMSEAVMLYSDVLDADATRVDAMLARGRLLLDLGDFPRAVSDFLRAEQHLPADADVQVALGDLFYGRKDYGKAVSYFNRALSIDGNHARAFAKRGMAHYYRKQYAAAVEDLQKARSIDATIASLDLYLKRAKQRV